MSASTIEQSNAEYFGEPMRRALRVMMVDAGIPPQVAEEVADITCHAALEAANALVRIAFAHPDQRLVTTALGSAIGILRSRLDLMEDGLKEVAASTGMRNGTATIQVRR